MKTLSSWLPTLGLLALLFPPPAQAFDNPQESTIPEISLAFPFAQQGEQVVNSLDVLVNPDTVIPAGSIFLTIFVPPQPGDVDVKKHSGKVTREQAYITRVPLPDKKDSLTPLQQTALDRATREPWKSQMVYRAALQQYRFDELRLVFKVKGSDEMALEAFNLPEGMFLAGEGNETRVLAVQKDSPASRLGLLSGAVLLKVNEQSLQGGLNHFKKVYFAEKKASQQNEAPLNLTVQMPGGAGIKTVTFSTPRKLKLNDFFNASDVSAEPTPKPDGETPAPAPAPAPQPVDPLAPLAP